MIRVIPHGHESAAASLDGSRIRSQITQAIRKALKEGKSSGKKFTKARYISDINRFGKISSRASGLRGRLTVSGSRNLIKRFRLSPSTRPPHRPPGGLSVEVVRGQGGQLPHAFVNSAGIVFEREGKKRLPIRHLSTVSIVGAWSRVGAQVEQAIARHLENQLSTVM
ncbi:MAG: hypothetical protein IJG33_00070 [Selenomonadaceae bacterium]|nr:hypothetical protein [Selenomonadaceae bacterium]